MEIENRLQRYIKHKIVSSLAKALVYFFRKEVYVSIFLKPKNVVPLKALGIDRSSDAEFVIVLQGPVSDQEALKYLQATLHIYRKIYPNLKIVVSSYILDKEFLKQLDSAYYDQLLCIDDEDLKSNFERQIKSASEGINAAGVFKRKYVIKSRVDQRLTEPAAMLYFKFLLESFPPHHKISDVRILGSSFNSWLYRPLGISDMLVVGSYPDMIKFWEFDDSIKSYSLVDGIVNYRESWLSDTSLHFESFLAARFMAKYGFRFSTNPIQDNLRMWRDFMVVADANVIGHEWKKRSTFFIGNTLTKYSSSLNPNSLREISFLSWLALYVGEFTLAEIDGFKNF